MHQTAQHLAQIFRSTLGVEARVLAVEKLYCRGLRGHRVSLGVHAPDCSAALSSANRCPRPSTTERCRRQLPTRAPRRTGLNGSTICVRQQICWLAALRVPHPTLSTNPLKQDGGWVEVSPLAA